MITYPQWGNWPTIIQLENVQRRFTRLIDGMGLMLYSDRLAKLKLTTIAESRSRGDLIETCKIVSGNVNYGSNFMKLSRSGINLVSSARISDKYRRGSFSDRVIKHWNSLPVSVKLSKNINSFKSGLENYKKKNLLIDTGDDNFWGVSNHVMARIESDSYLSNKETHNAYLLDNPWVAKRAGINLYQSQARA